MDICQALQSMIDDGAWEEQEPVGEEFDRELVERLDWGQHVYVYDNLARIWVCCDTGDYVCQWVDYGGRIAAEAIVDSYEEAVATIDAIRPEYI